MTKAIFKSASVVSFMTLVSRVLGLARDLLAAYLFGVNSAVDTFYIAFKIPNFMRNIFAEGAFSQAFVPVLSDYKHTRSKAEVCQFIRCMSGVLLLILAIVTLFGLAGSSWLIHLFAPGLDPYRFHLASDMLRISFPYLMLISLSAFISAILNCYNHFVIPALTPALLNLCLIITAVLLSHYMSVPVKSQAWGVLIAGFVQVLFQLPILYRFGFSIFPLFSVFDRGVLRVFKLILPALLGVSIGQVSIILNTVLASFLSVGSTTWLYYSERLAYFPLGVFGVALTTVMLPPLSRHYAMKSEDEFAHLVGWGLRLNLLIGVPAALIMFMISGPLIVSLFQYGKFTLHDVFMTQQSVVGYALGLPAFMLIKLLSSAFYAQLDTRTPVRMAMISLLTGMILSMALIIPFKHAGLALATSMSAWINTILLWIVLSKRSRCCKYVNNEKFILKLALANSVLVFYLWWSPRSMMTWVIWSSAQRLVHILLLGSGAVILYVFTLWFCKEYLNIYRYFNNNFNLE